MIIIIYTLKLITIHVVLLLEMLSCNRVFNKNMYSHLYEDASINTPRNTDKLLNNIDLTLN